MRPTTPAVCDLAELARVLAASSCNVVASLRHGLRISGTAYCGFELMPVGVKRWLQRTNRAEILLSAHHFETEQWEASLRDEAFPEVFQSEGGANEINFVKVLFINSFDPGLQFVLPYRPTAELAWMPMQKKKPNI